MGCDPAAPSVDNSLVTVSHGARNRIPRVLVSGESPSSLTHGASAFRIPEQREQGVGNGLGALRHPEAAAGSLHLLPGTGLHDNNRDTGSQSLKHDQPEVLR